MNADDTPHQLAATWDGVTMKFYVDGVLFSSSAHTLSNLDWDNAIPEIGVLTEGSTVNWYQPARRVQLALIAARALTEAQLVAIWQDPGQLVQ
jgi:hypothetical protein